MHAQKTILGPENKNTLKSLSSSSKIYLLNLFLQPHSSFGGNFLHGRDGKKRRRILGKTLVDSSGEPGLAQPPHLPTGPAFEPR